jgi:hypothetical protein
MVQRIGHSCTDNDAFLGDRRAAIQCAERRTFVRAPKSWRRAFANYNLIAFAMIVTTAAIADRMRLSPPGMFRADGLVGSHRLGFNRPYEPGLTNQIDFCGDMRCAR